MPNPILEPLVTEITEAVTVMESATVMINGFGAELQTAVDAALANGATAEQLAPFTALKDALDAKSNDLSAAILARTPGQPATVAAVQAQHRSTRKH